jgi:hypothetical protein
MESSIQDSVWSSTSLLLLLQTSTAKLVSAQCQPLCSVECLPITFYCALWHPLNSSTNLFTSDKPQVSVCHLGSKRSSSPMYIVSINHKNFLGNFRTRPLKAIPIPDLTFLVKWIWVGRSFGFSDLGCPFTGRDASLFFQ